MSVIYGAACEDCPFTFESGCDSTTHTAAERHARGRDHAVVYGSYDARNAPWEATGDPS